MKKILLSIIIWLFMVNIGFGAYIVDFFGLSNIFNNKLVGIHFKGAYNDFGGFLFVTGKKTLSSSENINSNGNSISDCQEQLRGYYFNPMHGDVLYPLDNETKQNWVDIDSNNYSGLDLIGGFYTTCTDHLNSIYGEIVYKVKGSEKFRLYAGFEGDYTGNKMKLNFKDNLQFIERNDKQNLVGLMYDNTYGLAFVGGKVVSGFNYVVDNLNNGVDDYITTIENIRINTTDGDLVYIIPTYGVGFLTKLVIKGLANIPSGKTNNILKSFKYFSQKRGTIFMDSKLLNIGNIKSIAKKKAYKMCSGKWNEDSDNIIDEGKTNCIKDNNKKIFINSDITLNNKVTNIVILGKGNELIIKDSQVGSGYINIFMDEGMVLFDNDDSALVGVDKKGEYSEINAIVSGFVFNGNIIVNGFIGGTDDSSYDIQNFEHKLYIKGSLASLNTIGINDARKEYIEEKFGPDYVNYINLQDVFKWECIGLTGSDGSSCSNTGDIYNSQSLIIKKAQYKNPILK